ncbi:MAG: helix-turn-helix transcriptional regulator [Oscillospiraceae bacterium]|nr:helix-turn-helix transcriptional regulator [Oscillospiraceae bacterium]
MNSIGEKIRELRRARDMTQDELAALLGVAYQTVSKWETGATSPDLSLIVPIARLFGITTDELFSYNESADGLRLAELQKRYDETFKSGNIQARLEISKQAAKEFPADMKWLERFGSDLFCNAIDLYAADDAKTYEEERDKAIGILRTVIDLSSDDETKCSAIVGIVQCLLDCGRKEEALSYADRVPKISAMTRLLENIRLDCLEGEEQKREKQRHLLSLLTELLRFLGWHYKGLGDLEIFKKSTETAISLIELFFPDGVYLDEAYELAYLYCKKAKWLADEKKTEEAEECLRKAFGFAAEYDGIEGEYTYTAPLFDLLTFDRNQQAVTGETTLTEDIRNLISRNTFYASVKELVHT